jgi:hypothetical protein
MSMSARNAAESAGARYGVTAGAQIDADDYED